MYIDLQWSLTPLALLYPDALYMGHSMLSAQLACPTQHTGARALRVPLMFNADVSACKRVILPSFGLIVSIPLLLHQSTTSLKRLDPYTKAQPTMASSNSPHVLSDRPNLFVREEWSMQTSVDVRRPSSTAHQLSLPLLCIFRKASCSKSSFISLSTVSQLQSPP